ncbi:MAG: hypothetical protein OXB88_09120, partial [Bacteriovoracales bacterium]|nr:hypothetical protein [Bacteriovoracales bacterium]
RAQICPGDRVRVPILVHNPEEASKYYEEYFGPREREIERGLKEYKKGKLEVRNYKGSKSIEIPDWVIQHIKNLSMIRKAGEAIRDGYMPEHVFARVGKIGRDGEVYLEYDKSVENNKYFSKERDMSINRIGITSGCTDNGVCAGMDSYIKDEMMDEGKLKKVKVVAINPISKEVIIERKIIPKNILKRKIVAEKERLTLSERSIILAEGCMDDEDEAICVGDGVLVRYDNKDDLSSVVGIDPISGGPVISHKVEGNETTLYLIHDKESPNVGLTSGCMDQDKVCVGEKVYPTLACGAKLPIGPAEVQAINPYTKRVLLDIGGGTPFLRELRSGVSSEALGLTSGCLGEDKRICVGDEVKVDEDGPLQGEVVALDPYSGRAVLRGVLGEESEEHYYCSPLESVSRSKRSLFTHARNLFGLTEDISLGEKEETKDSKEIYDGPRKATTGDDKSDDSGEPVRGVLEH